MHWITAFVYNPRNMTLIQNYQTEYVVNWDRLHVLCSYH